MLTLVLSAILLVFFYGKILVNPGEYIFATGGDGLRSYYGTYYHVKYDSDFGHSMSQNYPFGESMHFGDSQPLISDFMLLLKNLGFDYSNYTIAVINLMMILSIALGALVIFILLRNLGLPFLYSMLVANIIAFLSPQVDRMGGISAWYMCFIFHCICCFYTDISGNLN
ncbi:MAG: hypothetical protein R2771_05300 [Saprospiraceae bacterium]